MRSDRRRDGHKRVFVNAMMLYGMTAAKIVLPLMTLPYLTRVLSKDCYGVVACVKSIMCLAQVLIDFGFMLSATKDVALAGADKAKVNAILGDVLAARLVLSVVAALGMLIAALSVPLLHPYVLFTMLNFAVVFLTVFLFDFFFSGIEEMAVITKRYVLMRGISVALTFAFVRSDADIILLPVLEILGSFAAIALVVHEIRRRGYSCRFTGARTVWVKLKESSVYFLSNAATTTFGTLQTLLIGIYLSSEQVAEWSLCFQFVCAVQMFYTPLADSLYPHMVKNRDIRFAMRLIAGFTALIAVGCIVVWYGAEFAVTLVGGEKYVTAAPLLRCFIPLIFFSFPAIAFGWPMLGALGGVRETTMTTVVAGMAEIGGLVALACMNAFGVIALALLRGGTDFMMFAMRSILFARACRSLKHGSRR